MKPVAVFLLLLGVVGFTWLGVSRLAAAGRVAEGLNDRLHVADSTIAAQRAQMGHAAARLVSDTVHVVQAVTRVQRIVDTLVLHPVTKEDSARAVAQLPGLAAAATAEGKVCHELVTTCGEYKRQAEGIIASYVDEVATLKAAVGHAGVPRLGGYGDALYDPINHAPKLAGGLLVHVAGPWSLHASGEQRFESGERPRLYVGGRYTF